MEIYDKIIDFTNNSGGGDGTSFTTAMLSYPTGTFASSDSTLYNYIKGMYDTGVDTLENTYTFEGSPTITSDGWINGFPDGQYCGLKDNDILKDAGNKNFIINFHIVYKPSGARQSLLEQHYTAYGNYIGINADGNIMTFFGTNGGEEGYCDMAGQTALTEDNEYWFRIVRSGTEAYLFLSTDGINFALDATVTGFTQSVNAGNSYSLGRDDHSWMLECTSYIDLNGFNYTVIDSGSFVGKYFDCKYLSSGSKCVDSSKASIINNMAKSAGSALYYIIDTTNQTVTLPQGDIFGFISTLFFN